MGIHRPGFDGYLRSPDTAQEILTIQYSAIATEQLVEQLEFNTGEKDRLCAKADTKGLWIKNKIPHHDHSTGRDTLIYLSSGAGSKINV